MNDSFNNATQADFSQPAQAPKISYATTTSIWDIVKTVLGNFTDFKTRTSRKVYWMYILFGMLVYTGLAILAAPFVIMGYTTATFIVTLFILFVQLFFAIPTIAVLVRRLHDAGFSGLLGFIGLVPIIGGVALLVLLLKPSQPHTNKWGNEPV